MGEFLNPQRQRHEPVGARNAFVATREVNQPSSFKPQLEELEVSGNNSLLEHTVFQTLQYVNRCTRHDVRTGHFLRTFARFDDSESKAIRDMVPIIDPEEDYLTIAAAEEQMAITEAARKKELGEAQANMRGTCYMASPLLIRCPDVQGFQHWPVFWRLLD